MGRIPGKGAESRPPGCRLTPPPLVQVGNPRGAGTDRAVGTWVRGVGPAGLARIVQSPAGGVTILVMLTICGSRVGRVGDDFGHIRRGLGRFCRGKP